MCRHALFTKATLLCALAASLVLAGCGGGTNVTALPSPAPSARLYVAGDFLPLAQGVAYFTAPFSSASTATASFATASGSGLDGIAVDASGNVIVADENNKTVTGYARPDPTTSTLFTISTPFLPGEVAFDSLGKLYITDQTDGEVDVVTPPFSSASTLQSLISGVPDASGICFDTAQNLYAVEYSSGTILAYAPPYTGAATATVSTGLSNVEGCAIDTVTSQLVVSSVSAPKVAVYNLPLASASLAATLTFSSSTEAAGVDSAGRLYVGTDVPEISVFAPPFTSASTPLFSFPIVNADNAMAFGH
jgi:streptogramin lyase